MTIDHKGVVRVVNDTRQFHLQNSVEMLNGAIDVGTIIEKPWVWIGPAIAIAITVLAARARQRELRDLAVRIE